MREGNVHREARPAPGHFTCVPEMSLETTHLTKQRKKKRVRGRKEKERESERRRRTG